ncbi:RUS family member 1 [Pectinophora gossypiella]|uniref:RUS family member 1 n=1 Tax=Pectinophora gossypiella TaxID=13191 RepID=UPI00214EC699|nr:RUS family member 1 [Pectinophora gossypiella]XP_049884651.1 RUS family member 1 [Pectinophora gossypiella]
MFIYHEGEILFKEKYGSSPMERFYVKPPEQINLVVLEEGKPNGLQNWFSQIFLPHGYPDSVSKDYIAYQMWDTAQAFSSTITGTLATQEVLRGVGVGSTQASPLAATITWVLKDGCGHIGRILFAYTHGTNLDAYSKKWRLYADVLNDAAMCLEVALPVFKPHTTLILCISTTMKAIVGVAGGATRVALTQHHALRGNMADVNAKDSAQETAVNLVASFTALLLITICGSSITLFFLMIVLHIVFNYCAVRAVCLRTLNEPRFIQVIDTYLKHEVISNPCEINQNEPIIFYQMGKNFLDLKQCGFHIELGCSIKRLMWFKPKHAYWNSIKNVYADKEYMLYGDIARREMYVLLGEESTVDSTLCAYFHAVLLSIIICAINDEPLAVYANQENPRPFAQVCHTIQAAHWSREATDKVGNSGFLYEPSYDLLEFVDKIVQKEWPQIRLGLRQTGWDLSKHLLLVDEWRMSTHFLKAKDVRVSVAEDESSPTYRTTSLRSLNQDALSQQKSSKSLIKDKINVTRETFTIEPAMVSSELTLIAPSVNLSKAQLHSEDNLKASSSQQMSSKIKLESPTKQQSASKSKLEVHENSKQTLESSSKPKIVKKISIESPLTCPKKEPSLKINPSEKTKHD